MRSGRRKWWLWLSLLAFLWVLLCNCNCVGAGAGGEAVIVKVGVVLDLNSTVGQMSKTAIQLALSDFYTANPKYKTRLSLLFKDAGDVVEAASAGTYFIFTSIILFFLTQQRKSDNSNSDL